MNGIGRMIYGDKKNDGDIYKGEWKNNKKNGYGEYYYEDGKIYKGEFRDD